MKYDGTWGAHVELQAAALLFKLPIYMLTQKGGSGDYYWEIFKPMKDPLELPDSTIESLKVPIDHYIPLYLYNSGLVPRPFHAFQCFT